MTQSTSQTQQMIEYLKGGNKLTGLQALSLFGCYGGFRARMSEIKEQYPEEFRSEFIKLESGKTIKQYWLEFKPKQLQIF